jgi:hypothetical protein
MVSWRGITGLTRCYGLWRFLIARDQGRTAIELERERNRATAIAISMLPGDCELLEYEPQGRLRVIRRSVPPPAAPGVTGERLPRLDGGLGR